MRKPVLAAPGPDDAHDDGASDDGASDDGASDDGASDDAFDLPCGDDAPGDVADALDPAVLADLPIFPLPNAVLLPGGVLPLHVFEPRYREMTRDCLAGRRAMAIALLRTGRAPGDVHRPAVHPVCGLGTIICCEELPDGRFHLLLRGVARVRIQSEHPADRAYRRVAASVLADDGTARPDALQAGHRELLALCDRLARALDDGGVALSELVHAQPSGGACADVIAAALLTDPRRRQAMLEQLDAASRVAAAVELVTDILGSLGPDADEDFN